jgi:hypothetical protein
MLSTQRRNGAPRRTRAETAGFVVESLSALGLKPNPGSRLMRMLRVLEDTSGTILPDHPDFETALEADRDMQLLQYVFEQDHAKSRHVGLVRLLRKLVDDSVLPQDDREISRGRDTQFELFVAAICQAAGFIPVDYLEPDVTCNVQGVQIGIAAKRIKSEVQVKKRIKKAAEQIQASGHVGIIALDTSLGLNPNNNRITRPIPDEVFVPLYREAINQFLHRYNEQIRGWVRGRGVLGIIVHDHQVRFTIDTTWWLCSMTMRFCTAENEAAMRLFNSFELPYIDALPKMQHL